jgi:hypothetical protein
MAGSDLEPKDWGAGDSDRRQTGSGTPTSADGGTGGGIVEGAETQPVDDPALSDAITTGARARRSPDTGPDVGPTNRSGSGGSGGPTEGGADEEGSGALSLDEMLGGGSGEAEPRH